MLLLLTRSPAQLLLLKQTISQALLEFHVGSIFRPRFFISKTYLITCRSSLQAAGFVPSLAFDSSLVALARLGHSVSPGTTAYLHQNNTPTDLQQKFFTIIYRPYNQKFKLAWSFMNSNILHMLAKFFPIFLMGWGCPNQALFLSLENFILQDNQSCSPSMTLSISSLLLRDEIASSIVSKSPTIRLLSVYRAMYVKPFALFLTQRHELTLPPMNPKFLES